MSDKVRVRFAPSPTGALHIGGVRTALYNYLFARKNGGDFILRIEDTDQTRFVPGAEEYIVEALKWLGIAPDEGPGFGGETGPYRQSERKHLYRQYADQLIESGHAYYAFDTPEELNETRERAKAAKVPAWQYNNVTRSSMKNSLTLPEDEVKRRLDAGDPYVIRIKMPRNEEVRVNDLVRGWVVVNTNQLDDKVLFKADGMPTYHLANVVDDHLMGITHVIRGEEWLPSAPLHVLLYQCLGWEDTMPTFAHLSLILRPEGGGKLSKRDGDRLGFPVFPLNWLDQETGDTWSGYRENGWFPEAVVNLLAFLGWNPGTNEEVFSLEELIEAFTIERVGKSGAKFDLDKARWYNQYYLRTKSNEELAALAAPYLLEDGIEADSAFVAEVCEMMKERASFVKDIPAEGPYFFVAPADYDAKTVRKKWKEETPERMQKLHDALAAIEDFNADQVETTFKGLLEELEVGMGAMLPNFRVLVTGKGMGPSMFAIAAILGKEETLRRIAEGIDKIVALKASIAAQS